MYNAFIKATQFKQPFKPKSNILKLRIELIEQKAKNKLQTLNIPLLVA